MEENKTVTSFKGFTGDRHGEIVFTGPHVVAVCKQAK